LIVTLPAPSRPKTSVERLSFVDRYLAERFLVIYRDAFAPLETLAPARQGLTDEEFMDQMFDPSVMKFVAWDDDDEPAALAFMATDLTKVPWISVPYFRARFPEHYERGAIYYFGALLVSPEHQGGPWASRVLRLCTRTVLAARAIAVFDCCEHNVGRKLPDMIGRVAAGMTLFDATELEAQRYYAYLPAV
jgi:hypothetical protein